MNAPRRALLATALAVLAIGRAGPGACEDGAAQGAAERLAAGLAAPHPDARREAALALRALGVAALPALAAVEGPDGAPQVLAARALERRIREDWERAHTPPGMVYVPEGEVLLAPGSLAGRLLGETVVRVPAFYLDRTEVTVAAWRAWKVACVEGALGEPPAEPGTETPVAEEELLLPATGMAWGEAAAFAARARGGRLPRVEEFERALRGSGTREYPWGTWIPRNHANLQGQGPGRLVGVGSYPRGATPFGALDLLGNAAEWCSTLVPEGAGGRPLPLALGGSFASPPGPGLGHATRDRSLPVGGEGDARVGFRVARDAEPLPPPSGSPAPRTEVGPRRPGG